MISEAEWRRWEDGGRKCKCGFTLTRCNVMKQRAAILIWSRTLDDSTIQCCPSKSCRSAGEQQAGICWCLLPARAFCSFCSHTCLCIFELCVCMWGAQPSPKWRCWKWRAKHQGKNHTRVSSVCFSWLGSARLGLRNLLRRLNVHPSPVTQRWGRRVFGEKREEEDGGGEEEEGSHSGHRWDEEMHQFPTRRNHLNVAVL